MLPLWHQSKEYEDGNSANKGEGQQGTEVKTKETQSTDDSERLYSKRKTSSDIAVSEYSFMKYFLTTSLKAAASSFLSGSFRGENNQ